MADEERRAGDWLSVAEAMAVAGVSRQTLYVWMRRRHVLAVRIEGIWRIERASLERLLRLRGRATSAGMRLDTLLHWLDPGESAPGEDAPGGRIEEEDIPGPRVRLAQAGDAGSQGGVVGEAEDVAERADGIPGLEHRRVDRCGRRR